MTDREKKDVLLLIADISGYTEFMVSSDLEIEHSQHVISELMQSIIHQVEIPLEVSKLEGDAIFLFAVKKGVDYDWDTAAATVGEKLMHFFDAFHKTLQELISKSVGQCGGCTCGACTNVDLLRLKVVVHSGTALFYRLHDFDELSGSDVILVHRLLKNSTTHDEYLLVTEQARADLHFPDDIEFIDGSETYDHIGQVRTLTWYPETQQQTT